MSVSNWQEIYTGYSTADLNDELTRLRDELKTMGNMMSQGSGSKNYTRDMNTLQERLTAATREVRRRSGAASPRVGVPDFS